MIATVHSATIVGVDARAVEVEAELSQGLPYFSIIGLGDTAVQEARYRIQAALRNSEIALPHKRITVNLAPAGLRKDGSSLDLPMALSLLVGADLLSPEVMQETVAVGELALSGGLRPIRGVLPIAEHVRKSRRVRRLIVPRDNGGEAIAVEGIEVLAASTLKELLEHLRGERVLEPPTIEEIRPFDATLDLCDVKGQGIARRALEICAAGSHNLLLVGNPGSGKTMLARRIPSVLPKLTKKEQIEVTKIWSAAGLTIGADGLLQHPPFRAPHHTASEAALIGGGANIRPGEVSLSHRGVLFLDEMPELPRRVLESMRQPLEDREVVISRVRQSVKLPAAFMLVGAANPCPCGWLGHPSGRCQCTREQTLRYVSRISGALLDRIDLILEVPSLTTDELMSEASGEASKEVRKRVSIARQTAMRRSGCANGRLSTRMLKRYARLDLKGRKLLRKQIDEMQLSARSMDRMLRVARTIADLHGQENISTDNLREALCYRQPKMWGAQGSLGCAA